MGRPKKIISQTIQKEPIVEINIVTNPINPINKPKRGRKPTKNIPKIGTSNDATKNENNNIICEIKEENSEDNQEKVNYQNIENLSKYNNEDKNEKAPLKKRGRKPKGGKIIQQLIVPNNITETKPNIILHLKCSLKDLKNNLFNNNLNGYNFDTKTELTYDIISSNINNDINNDLNSYDSFDNKLQKQINFVNLNDEVSTDNNLFDYKLEKDDNVFDNNNNNNNNNNNMREIWKKIKLLENNLHINNISDKKSACFWCTYDFDTPCIYIPKHFIKDSYHVYGCFCSPECATSYLMNENIDTSSKFERYHLLNHIYSKIYDYKKNIKPAPNPYYMLDKYYGNLNIHEYRALLKSERLFLVVDKPLTRIMPELHEDNDDFIINNKIIPSNTYQIKKKNLNKNLTKTSILNEKFGLTMQ